MAQKRYQCVADLQGDDYLLGTTKTAQEWKEWALKQREEADDSEGYKLVNSTPLNGIVKLIEEMYQLSIVEAQDITLESLVETMSTYHFRLQVIGADEKVKLDDLYSNLPIKERRKYDNYIVVGVEASLETSKESPVDKSMNIRPIMLITIEKEEQDE